MKHRFLLIVSFVFLLAACAAPGAALPAEQVTGSRSASYVNIGPAELQTMLQEKDFVFVNVHIPFEGDIADTDLSIAFDEIGDHLDLLPADKDARIVLYCRSGRMSAIAADTLLAAGYTQVYNLEGGFVAWEAQGYPVER